MDSLIECVKCGKNRKFRSCLLTRTNFFYYEPCQYCGYNGENKNNNNINTNNFEEIEKKNQEELNEFLLQYYIEEDNRKKKERSSMKPVRYQPPSRNIRNK